MALVASACGLIAIAAMMLSFTRYMHRGTAEPGMAAVTSIACRDAATRVAVACDAKLQDLGYGTWRAYLLEPKGLELVVRLTLSSAPTRKSGKLMLRSGYDRFGKPSANFAVSVDGGPPRMLAKASPPHWPRDVVDIPLRSGPVEIVIAPAGPSEAGRALVLDEVGVFASQGSINRVWLMGQMEADGLNRLFLKLHKLAWLVAALTLLASVSYQRGSRWLVSLGCGLIALIASHIVFIQTNGPEWAPTGRQMQAGGTVLEAAGANLNYGQHMAMSIAQGKGPVIANVPPWHRMPGYGYLMLPAVVKGDMVRTSANVLLAQIAYVSLGIAALAAALALIVPTPLAAIIGLLVGVLPKTPDWSQIESMMVGVACLLLAAACLFIADREKRGEARLSRHILLHLAFALWFTIRIDIAPLWVVTSLYLYAWPKERWRYLALPVGLMVLICVPWALFKTSFGQEFSLTTNSFGASLMVGQWEVPHPFVWPIGSDGAYFEFAKHIPLGPASKMASDYAVREVVWFWLTFPGFVISLVWHELLNAMQGQIAAGVNVMSWLQQLRGAGLGIVLTIVLSALIARYKPHRLLLLGGILAFNVPLYFLVFSSGGRFYNVAHPVIVLLPLVVLADRDFWTALWLRPWAPLAALALCLFIGLFGRTIDRWLIRSDEFRFAAPFLDPARSPLVKWKNAPFRWATDKRTMPLDGLEPAADVAATRSASVKIEAKANGPRAIAMLPLPVELAAFDKCRARIDLSVERGRVGIELQDAAAKPLPEASPFERQSWAGSGRQTVDLFLPVAATGPSGPNVPRIVLHAVGKTAPVVSLNQVVLYGCSKR